MLCCREHGSTHRRCGFAATCTTTVRHGIGIVMCSVDGIDWHAQDLSRNQRERCIRAGEINGTNDNSDCAVGLEAAGSRSGFRTTGPATGSYAYANLPALQAGGHHLLFPVVFPNPGFLLFLHSTHPTHT